MPHHTGFSPFFFTPLWPRICCSLLEFCSLSHHHLAKAHVLLFKAHSPDPFSLKPSLDLPVSASSHHHHSLMPGWNQLPLSLIPVTCKHTSMVVFITLHSGFPAVSFPGTAVSLKGREHAWFIFHVPKRASVSLSTQHPKMLNSIGIQNPGTTEESGKGNKIHSFSSCVSHYTRSLILKSYFYHGHM